MKTRGKGTFCAVDCKDTDTRNKIVAEMRNGGGWGFPIQKGNTSTLGDGTADSQLVSGKQPIKFIFCHLQP